MLVTVDPLIIAAAEKRQAQSNSPALMLNAPALLLHLLMSHLHTQLLKEDEDEKPRQTVEVGRQRQQYN
jgi:hypothetical protein